MSLKKCFDLISSCKYSFFFKQTAPRDELRKF